MEVNFQKEYLCHLCIFLNYIIYSPYIASRNFCFLLFSSYILIYCFLESDYSYSFEKKTHYIFHHLLALSLHFFYIVDEFFEVFYEVI